MQTSDLIDISVALLLCVGLTIYFHHLYELKEQGKDPRKVKNKGIAWFALMVVPFLLPLIVLFVLGADLERAVVYGLMNILGALLLAVGGIIATVIRHNATAKSDADARDPGDAWQDVVLATVSIGGVFLLAKAVYDFLALFGD